MAIKRCPKCGTQVHVSVYDCPRCGRMLVSRGKRWLARLPWLVATLAIAVLVWWLWRRRGS